MTKLLKQLFVDTFALYYITHLFHWNVVGSNFSQLHSLFEEQYTNLWEAVDTIAERIRQQDEAIDCTLTEIENEANIGTVINFTTGKLMVERLLTLNQSISEWLEEAIKQSSKDLVTQNLFIERKAYHDKQIWKLQSTLK